MVASTQSVDICTIHISVVVQSFDNAGDNPVYGMNIVDGCGTFSGQNGPSKAEEDPCPLYEDLDILGIILLQLSKSILTSI